MPQPSFDDQAFDATNAFDTQAFDFDLPVTPTVTGDNGRRRMASYVKRGGVGSLNGRTT